MTTYTDDDRQQARNYSATASADTRRAEREAREAHQWYRLAASMRASARALTQRPQDWRTEAEHGYTRTPADDEDRARTYERIANTYLRSSGHHTRMAAHHRDMAASCRERAARYAS